MHCLIKVRCGAIKSRKLLSVRGVFVDCVFLLFPLPPLPIVLVFSMNSVQCDGCSDWGWILAGGARGWVAGRAGLWGVLPTRVWVGSTSPHVPEHPTSICEVGVNTMFKGAVSRNFQRFCCTQTCLKID